MVDFQITGVHIGAYHAALVEVLVGRSENSEHFQVRSLAFFLLAISGIPIFYKLKNNVTLIGSITKLYLIN